MKYTVDYFINKFKNIPRNKWCISDYTDGYGKFCALGHCGENVRERTDESKVLHEFLSHNTIDINDGTHPHYKQKHPRTRILAALREVKKRSGK